MSTQRPPKYCITCGALMQPEGMVPVGASVGRCDECDPAVPLTAGEKNVLREHAFVPLSESEARYLRTGKRQPDASSPSQTGKRLIETMLEAEGEPTIFVCSPLQAQTVQAWALEECPGATALDSDVALPDGRVLRIVLRRAQ